MNACQKGKRGEREAAKAIRQVFGVGARRGQQFSGGKDSPDVIHGLTGLHLEVKRTEKLQLWAALEQAKADAGANVPAVMHRTNRREWILILPLADVPRLAEIVMENSHVINPGLSTSERAPEPAKNE